MPWPQAPPPRGGGFAVLWFGGGLVTGVVLTTLVPLVLFLALGLWLESEDWEDGDAGGFYLVDQSSVEKATAAPCKAMRDAGRAVVPMATPAKGSAQLRAFVTAGRRVVTAIDDSSPDRASRAWRDDWTRLLDAVAQHADDVRAGRNKPLAVPRDRDDAPITARMYDGSPSGCEVPSTIENLDPSAAEWYEDDSF
ncbi:MAG: hypothetical protein PGN07_07430 [Aeromicrobium erythreum]